MRLRHFTAIVELRTKIVSLSTFTLSLLYVLYSGHAVSWPLAALTLTAALAVDMGTTAFNSYFDFIRRVDHSEENREKEKVLVHEGVDPSAALRAAAGCYAAAVICGGIIAFFIGWEIALAGALCMAVGFLYTGGPVPISTTPFGEAFAGGFLGSIFFLIVVYILTETISGEAVLASLPSTLMIASILSANNACDSMGDSRAGRRTLAILLGPRFAGLLIPAWGIATVLVLLVLAAAGIIPGWILLSLALAAIPASAVYGKMFHMGFSHSTKSLVMAGISKIFFIFTLAYAAALALGISSAIFVL